MHEAFESRELVPAQKAEVAIIRQSFDGLWSGIAPFLPNGRLKSLTLTKLEEACLFAVKAKAFEPNPAIIPE